MYVDLEMPIKPIYGELETTVYLTPKQAEILREIKIEEIVGEDKTHLQYWFSDKWVRITPEQMATVIAKLTKLATSDPQNKNMATRVTKLLNESVQERWTKAQTYYNRHVTQLKEFADFELPIVTRELETEQYGYRLTTNSDNMYFGVGATIAPVTFVENGNPVLKWTADTGGMYLTFGGNDIRRKEQPLFDDLTDAIAYAHELVDAMVEERLNNMSDRITIAKGLVAELENA